MHKREREREREGGGERETYRWIDRQVDRKKEAVSDRCNQ